MNFSPIWLFDLDNTLHNADAGIFYIINRAMTDYMAQRLKLSEEAASDLRQDYWHRYGATLAGLQIHHPEIDIREFLRESHPIAQILAKLEGMEGTESVFRSSERTQSRFFQRPFVLRPRYHRGIGFGKPF